MDSKAGGQAQSSGKGPWPPRSPGESSPVRQASCHVESCCRASWVTQCSAGCQGAHGPCIAGLSPVQREIEVRRSGDRLGQQFSQVSWLRTPLAHGCRQGNTFEIQTAKVGDSFRGAVARGFPRRVMLWEVPGVHSPQLPQPRVEAAVPLGHHSPTHTLRAPGV